VAEVALTYHQANEVPAETRRAARLTLVAEDEVAVEDAADSTLERRTFSLETRDPEGTRKLEGGTRGLEEERTNGQVCVDWSDDGQYLGCITKLDSYLQGLCRHTKADGNGNRDRDRLGGFSFALVTSL
jgi:hypothetical protein